MSVEFERLRTPDEIAEMFGISTGFVRATCHRGREFHPAPSVDVGNGSRRCFRIRPSAFERWLVEEEGR